MNCCILQCICSSLGGNKLEGPIPEALLLKYRDGTLVLRLAYNFLDFIVVLISRFLSEHAKWLEKVFVHLFISFCESFFNCISKGNSVYQNHSSFNNLPLHLTKYASLGENSDLCQSLPCQKKKNKALVIQLVAASAIAVVLLIFFALAIYKRKRRGMSFFILDKILFKYINITKILFLAPKI